MFRYTTPAGFIKGMIRRFAPGKLRWIQGPTYKYTKGPKRKICSACLYGNLALGSRRALIGITFEAQEALSLEAMARGYRGYIAFSETPGRKKSEVMALLRAALKRVTPKK